MTVAKVFVSYAHADDQPFGQDTPGWVTYFVHNLQKVIAMQAGGNEVRCWMDHRLEPQRVVDDALCQLIRDSSCILAFLSPRYLESKWCQGEMATFVELVGGGKANDRVFVVELLPTVREKWHRSIQGISAITLWTESFDQPEPMIMGWPIADPHSHKDYWKKLNCLGHILARQIQNLPPLPHSATPITPVRPSREALQFKSSSPISVLINADEPDRELGERAQEILGELDVEATLAAKPLPTQAPEKYRKDLETQLEHSHGVIIVYGTTPPSWVQAQYGIARKILSLHRKGIWGGLLNGPPPEKPEHGLPTRTLEILDCRLGLHADPLCHFVETLRRELSCV